MVEYKPIGNYKSYKNTCHSGRHKKGLLMRPERNEKYICTNKQTKTIWTRKHLNFWIHSYQR